MLSLSLHSLPLPLRSLAQFLAIELILGLIAWGVSLITPIDATFKRVIYAGLVIVGVIVLIYFLFGWLGPVLG